MFDKDIRRYRMAPRSLNDAFGPYARLSVHRRKSRIEPLLWTLFYGIAVAAFWYALVLARAA